MYFYRETKNCQLLCKPLWVGLVSLVGAYHVAKCLQRIAVSKRRFLMFKNISATHICKIQRLQKYDRDGLQSAIGLKIAKYDRTGLQITTIGSGLQSVTKILKTWLQSAMGSQSATSLDYKAQRITKWYSTCAVWKRYFLRKDLILLLISNKDGEKNSKLVI